VVAIRKERGMGGGEGADAVGGEDIGLGQPLDGLSGAVGVEGVGPKQPAKLGSGSGDGRVVRVEGHHPGDEMQVRGRPHQQPGT